MVIAHKDTSLKMHNSLTFLRSSCISLEKRTLTNL